MQRMTGVGIALKAPTGAFIQSNADSEQRVWLFHCHFAKNQTVEGMSARFEVRSGGG